MKLGALRFVLAFAVAPAAYGQQQNDSISSDRPGIADGSEVMDAGRVQLETGIQRDIYRAGDHPERKTFLPTLLRVGMAPKWEARFESDLNAWMRQPDPDGAARMQAYAPFSLGLKHRLLGDAGPAQPSVGAILRISPASGSDRLRTRRTTGDFRIAADWELRPRWWLNPNFGWAIDEDGEGRRFGAALGAMTLSYKPAAPVEFFIDTGIQRPETKGGGSAAIYDAGFTTLISRDLQIDVSVGRRGTGSTPPRSFTAAGASIRF